MHTGQIKTAKNKNPGRQQSRDCLKGWIWDCEIVSRWSFCAREPVVKFKEIHRKEKLKNLGEN
jgi:hypothetical protein